MEAELVVQEHGLRSASKWQALADLRDYLAAHAGHSGYAERLRQGQSIGSGMVEGACKTVVGKRLKQTGLGGGYDMRNAWWRYAACCIAICGTNTGLRARTDPRIRYCTPDAASRDYMLPQARSP